jgi:hypothetical protein
MLNKPAEHFEHASKNINSLTHSLMELSPSREAANCAVTQEYKQEIKSNKPTVDTLNTP